jgi:hypothetical protein
LRSFAYVAGEHDGQQQNRAGQIQPRRPHLQFGRRHLRQGQHDAQAHGESYSLALYDCHISTACAVEYEQAQGGQQH